MASSQVTLNKWVTFHRPVEVEPALAVAALVVRHDEEAVDVLQPVEVERPVALDSIADRRDPVSVEDRRTLVEVPVGGLGGAAVQALGDLVAVLGHRRYLVDGDVQRGQEAIKMAKSSNQPISISCTLGNTKV